MHRGGNIYTYYIAFFKYSEWMLDVLCELLLVIWLREVFDNERLGDCER